MPLNQITKLNLKNYTYLWHFTFKEMPVFVIFPIHTLDFCSYGIAEFFLHILFIFCLTFLSCYKSVDFMIVFSIINVRRNIYFIYFHKNKEYYDIIFCAKLQNFQT